jgi:hypothetical protein
MLPRLPSRLFTAQRDNGLNPYAPGGNVKNSWEHSPVAFEELSWARSISPEKVKEDASYVPNDS